MNLRWPVIPIPSPIPRTAAANIVESERNRREEQQEIDQRACGQMNCIIKQPYKQQDDSDDNEHGASNHSRRPEPGFSNAPRSYLGAHWPVTTAHP
jgi:hypothetical protein